MSQAVERLRSFIDADPELVWLQDRWESVPEQPDAHRLEVMIMVKPARPPTAIERLGDAIRR